MRAWPWAREREDVDSSLMPTAPCLFLFYFHVETFCVSGTRTRLTTEGSCFCAGLAPPSFLRVQTTIVCPTEMRPDLMRRGNTLTRCEPTCCGAGGGLGGIRPRFSAGCQAVHAAPPTPSCRAPLTGRHPRPMPRGRRLPGLARASPGSRRALLFPSLRRNRYRLLQKGKGCGVT